MKIILTELTIYEIEGFYNKVLKELQNTKKSFTLNFSDVEKIDLSAVQLLISINKFCLDRNINFKVTNIQARQVKQIFKMFNLYEILKVQA